MLYASLRLYHTQCASITSDDDSFRLVVESACLLAWLWNELFLASAYLSCKVVKYPVLKMRER